MNIYKNKKSFPIVFENKDFKDEFVVNLKLEIDWQGYSALTEISNNIESYKSFLENNASKNKDTRKYKLLFLKGIVWIRESGWESNQCTSIVCRENDKLVAYITNHTNNMLDIPATLLTLSNKFVKAYGVKLKDFQYIEKAEFIKKFCLPFELTLDDYNEEYQKTMSSNFLREELTKLNAA